MSEVDIGSRLDSRNSKDNVDKAVVRDKEKQIDRRRSSQINVSGHEQELDRQFGLLSIISAGIVTGNTWTALGGAIVRTSLPLSWIF